MTSHKSTPLNSLNLLSPYHKKSAYALASNVESLISKSGLENMGFLTLTFPDNVTDPKEAYKRFDSFNRNYLRKNKSFRNWLCVKERQKRGAWHYHILIDCGGDIRTGFNWDEVRSRIYRGVPSHLLKLWKDLRTNLPKYGFGRSELKPIRTDGEIIGKYIGKYIAKHIKARAEEDKGVRLVSYSRTWPRNNSNFQWNTPNSKKWREQLARFAECYRLSSLEDIKDFFGTNWAFHLADVIINDNWADKLAFRKALQKTGFPFGANVKALGLLSVPVINRDRSKINDYFSTTSSGGIQRFCASSGDGGCGLRENSDHHLPLHPPDSLRSSCPSHSSAGVH